MNVNTDVIPMDVAPDDSPEAQAVPQSSPLWPLLEREQVLLAVADCFKRLGTLEWNLISQEVPNRSAEQLQLYYEQHHKGHLEMLTKPHTVPEHVLEDLPTPGSSSCSDNNLDSDFITPKRLKVSQVKSEPLPEEGNVKNESPGKKKQKRKEEKPAKPPSRVSERQQELKRRRTEEAKIAATAPPPVAPSVAADVVDPLLNSTAGAFPPEFTVVPESNTTADKRLARIRAIDAAAMSVSGEPTALDVQMSPLCFVCGSPDDPADMLTCSHCCESFHAFCLTPDRSPICEDPQLRRAWKCARCLTCTCCGSASDGARLLVCTTCERGFHTKCLPKPLAFVPFGDWRCPDHALCRSCRATSPGDQRVVEWKQDLCHQCHEYISAGHQCPICECAYDPMSYDVKMMCCELCEKWAHLECIQFSEDVYNAINELSTQQSALRDVAYHCSECIVRVNRPSVVSRLVVAWDGKSYPCHSGEQFMSVFQSLERGERPPPISAPAADQIAADAENGSKAAAVEKLEPIVESSALVEQISCCLCGTGSAPDLGRMLPFPHIADRWVHSGCLLWSKGARLGGEADTVLVTAHSILSELKRLKTVCSFCEKGPPPLLHCRYVGRCSRWVHLACCRPGLGPVALGLGQALCAEHARLPAMSPGIEWSQIGDVCHSKFVIPDPVSTPPSPPPTKSFRTWQDNLQELIDCHPNSVLTHQFATESEFDPHLVPVTTLAASKTYIRIGSMTVRSLGVINQHALWHTRHLFFPDSFSTARIFRSRANPGRITLFISSIVARSRFAGQLIPLNEAETKARVVFEGDDEPVFRVHALDDPDTVYASLSPLVWRHVLELLDADDNNVRAVGFPEAASGATAAAAPHPEPNNVVSLTSGISAPDNVPNAATPPTDFASTSTPPTPIVSVTPVAGVPSAAVIVPATKPKKPAAKEDLASTDTLLTEKAKFLLFLFGLSPAIMRLLETCPNADRCPEYQFSHWAIPHHRTAVPRHPYGSARLMPASKRPRKRDNEHRFVYSTLNGDDLTSAADLVRQRSAYERETPVYSLWKKMIQSPPSIVVHKSRIHGMGVFSLQRIQQGDMVIEYQGELIRHSVADKREREYEEAGIPCYLWRLTDTQIVDATFKGNMARFINHCCQPNCEVRIVTIQSTPKVVVFTKRDILAGEELSYDYMFELEDEKIPCMCGARLCRGYMN